MKTNRPRRKHPTVPPTDVTISNSIHQWANKVSSTLLHTVDSDTQTGTWLRVVITFFYMVLALLLFWVVSWIGRRLHIVSWLGAWPQVTTFVTMLAVATSFLLMMRIRLALYLRFQQFRKDLPTRDATSVGKGGKEGRTCSTNVGLLRPVAMMGVVLALASLVLGILMLIRGHDVAKDLKRKCFTYPEAQPFQNVSKRLLAFQKDCNEKERVQKELTDCPDFEKEFPPPASDVAYLLRLEIHTGCTGFCEPAAPLAFSDRETNILSDYSCAEAISRDVEQATMLTSAPSIFIGLCLAILGMLLLGFDQL